MQVRTLPCRRSSRRVSISWPSQPPACCPQLSATGLRRLVLLALQTCTAQTVSSPTQRRGSRPGLAEQAPLHQCMHRAGCCRRQECGPLRLKQVAQGNRWLPLPRTIRVPASFSSPLKAVRKSCVSFLQLDQCSDVWCAAVGLRRGSPVRAQLSQAAGWQGQPHRQENGCPNLPV